MDWIKNKKGQYLEIKCLQVEKNAVDSKNQYRHQKKKYTCKLTMVKRYSGIKKERGKKKKIGQKNPKKQAGENVHMENNAVEKILCETLSS